MAEATTTTLAGFEGFYQLELHLHDWHDNQLSDTLAGCYLKRGATPIPAGDHDFPLVVRIDQPNQITQYDAVLMTKT